MAAKINGAAARWRWRQKQAAAAKQTRYRRWQQPLHGGSGSAKWAALRAKIPAAAGQNQRL